MTDKPPFRKGSPPETIAYENFDIEVSRVAKGTYTVRVIGSPEGESEEAEPFRFSFDEEKLAEQEDSVKNALRRGKTGQILLDDRRRVQEFGALLFKNLFTGNILRLYDRSICHVRQEHKGLRIRLRLNKPELDNLPWEFLYDPQQTYICFARNTPVVRYLNLGVPPEPFPLKLPLRILIMAAAPNDCDTLDVNREMKNLRVTLEPLQKSGDIEMKWAEKQTWQYLQDVMREGPWHIFHFIGHGGIDPGMDQGFIRLIDEKTGGTYRLYAEQLAQFLRNQKDSLRLAVLNCCESAVSGQRDIISSTSSILLKNGISAVVAMQYAISDEAAIAFSWAFYKSLADRYPIDASMAEARNAMSAGCAGSVEWGIPVLSMRSMDGVLFTEGRGQVSQPAAPAAAPAGTAGLYPAAAAIPEAVPIGSPLISKTGDESNKKGSSPFSEQSRNAKLPSGFPYRVKIYPLDFWDDSQEQDRIVSLFLRQNKIQSMFQMEPGHCDNPEAVESQIYEHAFSDVGEFIDKAENLIQKSDPDGEDQPEDDVSRVVITSSFLPRNYIQLSHTQMPCYWCRPQRDTWGVYKPNRFFVVSLATFRQLHPGMPVDAFLLRQIQRVCMRVIIPVTDKNDQKRLTHPETRGCMFDFVENHYDARYFTNQAFICNDCKEDILAAEEIPEEYRQEFLDQFQKWLDDTLPDKTGKEK